MNKYNFKNRLIISALLALFLTLYACSVPTDESLLRKEFNIPETAVLLSYKASPETSGWFGREGLKIDIVFQFNETDFANYITEAEKSGSWRALPISQSFLMKIGSIARHKQGLIKSYELTGKKLPKEGSIYNPTEQKLYENFIKTLPLDVKYGFYQCRTAGDNILFNTKTIVQEDLTTDLNDFMLAILNTDNKTLSIKVSTTY